MKEIYILFAVGMTASIIGAIPFFNSSREQSNQTGLLSPAENQAKLNTNSKDIERSNVGGSNEAEHIIDP
jgi:hypothetical protein